MTSSAGSEREGGRRRRRKPRRKSAGPPSPVEVLAKAGTEAVAEAAEVPMTPAEVARMKATLRFLREHREILKLKVNAAEDLLLNGRREPLHRGLCQHLLSKLDRSRVIVASERLPPAEATELLAGIVRFAPEVPYILRFLQCVKASANRAATAAALTQALEQLDLRETSAAQLRDILLLIVEVFPAEQLPVFVFTLLEREEIRSAIERSHEGFPDSLARLLVPLGALHASIGRAASGPRARKGAERLVRERVEEGARLLLESGTQSIAELPEPLRRRLLVVGSDAVAHAAADRRAGAAPVALLELFRGLGFRDAAARASAAWRLVAAFFAADQDALAARILREDLEGSADAERARRWLAFATGPRIDRVALERPRSREQGRRRERGANEPSGRAAQDALDADRWQRGFHLPTQREVLVRAMPAPAEALSLHAELRRRACIPGVAPVVVAALAPTAADGLAVLAVASPGPTLEARVERGAPAELVLGWCNEAVRLLHALALSGLELPDAALRRFNVDAAQRLWLTDLWGVRDAGTAASPSHLLQARTLSERLLDTLELDVVASASRQRLDAATNAGELIDALALIARGP